MKFKRYYILLFCLLTSVCLPFVGSDTQYFYRYPWWKFHCCMNIHWCLWNEKISGKIFLSYRVSNCIEWVTISISYRYLCNFIFLWMCTNLHYETSAVNQSVVELFYKKTDKNDKIHQRSKHQLNRWVKFLDSLLGRRNIWINY